MDCVVFQETNLTKVFYIRETSNFGVMAMEAPSAHRGGVAIFYHKLEHFTIKEL